MHLLSVGPSSTNHLHYLSHRMCGFSVNTSDVTMQNLKYAPTPQYYAKFTKATLASIIVFNRRPAGEVSKILFKNFQERNNAELHQGDYFEQKLCDHFSRVEIRGKRDRKVAVLLTPDMVEALTYLVEMRKDCKVQKEQFPVCQTVWPKPLQRPGCFEVVFKSVWC